MDSVSLRPPLRSGNLTLWSWPRICLQGGGRSSYVDLSRLSNSALEAVMKFRPYLILAMLSIVPCARGDVVVLKNGDRLTGHWTSVVEGKVSFQSDLVGDVTIPLSQIQSFAPAEAVVVLLPEGETASGNMSVVNGEKLVVRNSSGTRTLSAESARAIYPEAIYEPNGARRSQIGRAHV